ncbi:DNA polymerase III subunit delta [Salibacterium qingdaonense]|uniref:DNA polymerase III subunit delta n=1 Tax=Salibacterium qingdaonense TaxID=266892 RepID=A0A1I4JHS0_9BACI|nr:DNA polymerase III subunit delta [Salibacterium qingdaonense]SFL65821.1 DNA polymerase III, delta subunit [Salibacterium qingdaonense]
MEGNEYCYGGAAWMDYIPLLNDIENQNIAPLYLLYGTEAYLITNIMEKITANTLAEEERDFNHSVYDMKEVPVETALEEGETLPFFGSGRVVVLKNCYFLTGAKDKEKVEHNLSYLEEYIDNPPQETVMIFTAPYEKLDERKKIVKKLKKQGVFLEASSFDEKNMDQWIERFCKTKNISITSGAKEKMMQLAGKDMMMLSSEMDKLTLYAGEEKQITEEMVEELVPRNLEDNVFELVDHVVHGRAEKAFRIYYDLMKQNEEPIKILTLLARQFRMILHVSQLKKTGYSRQKMASRLKVHPYAVKVAEEQSRTYAEPRLKEVLQKLAEADERIKTGKMDKYLQLELSIAGLAA